MEAPEGRVVPIEVVPLAGYPAWRSAVPSHQRAWADSSGFKAEAGAHLLLPDADGNAGAVLLVVEDPVGHEPGATPGRMWDYAGLPAGLPGGDYAYRSLPPAQAEKAAIGWMLGAYVFDRFKSPPKEAPRPKPRLVWPSSCDRAAALRVARAASLARDLITTPAENLGPAELEQAVRAVAAMDESAFVTAIAGDALLAQGYPAVHRVGRASTRPPRLIDLHWAAPGLRHDAPRVTLVGKGVCFDTGGLDLKSADGMKLMKKDMGGSAIVLALAQMVINAKLPVRLRLLIPAVDNAVAGNAMRPMDVMTTRKGLTVEIGNTDAEGRLILCDALAEACREKPDLLVDVATLTGAARVALGPDLPALFCDDETLAADILAAGRLEDDPLWRMPLHKPYRKLLDSKVADLNNVSDGPHAGAITAALFLKDFVDPAVPWAHIDVLAWNLKPQRGRPEGGEAQTLRALWRVLRQRFGRA
ncbi:MAG: leucyl aminopeptidase family protein [Alphaproteobacteria bacterium]|nr:leucyl aminopeptidase family protein [Alphaproteobacteria bacterium]